MTAKKRWLNKIYHDSQDHVNNTQVNISWSSSESDDSIYDCMDTRNNKRFSSLVKKWMKSNYAEDENKWHNFAEINLPSTSSSHFQSLTSECKKENLLTIPIQSSNKTNEKEESVEKREVFMCQSYATNFSIESPIINSLKLEELSPVLVQDPGNIDTNDERSPILGKRRILKTIRLKYKRERNVKQVLLFKSSNSSPDLFENQFTQIIDSSSPDLLTNNNSSVKINESQSTECIAPFPSQHSSQIINSDSDNSLIRTDGSSLYHLPPPRKKMYKKGGVASLLKKALHIQRTRLSIWQHEIYTKKIDNVLDINEDSIIEFTIQEQWKEYGSALLKCELCNFVQSKESDGDLFCSFGSFFIIIIGSSTTLNIFYTTNCKYKLFPPYRIKHVTYKCENVPCYFNVTKILNSKE